MKKFFRGFKYAFSGLVAATKSECNMRFHLCAMVCVVVAGFVFCISATEWLAVLLCCGMVVGAEMLNTAIEKLADAVEPAKNERIKFVKDAAAGGVLACAIAAACVGLIIFVPKIIALF